MRFDRALRSQRPRSAPVSSLQAVFDTRALAFDKMADAVLLVDEERRYVDANAAATVLFGVPREALLGKRIDDFAPPPPGFDVESSWREFLQSGHQEGVFPLTRFDGSYRLVEYRATANLVPGRHLSVLRDVTERVERETQFHKLADSLPFVVTRFDRARRHLYVNATITRYLGIAPSEIVGKTNEELGVDCRLLVEWNRAIDAALSGAERELSFEWNTPNGLRAFAARVLPETVADGHIETALCVMRDVTDEQQETAARLRLAEQFIGILSHDLRNPLNAVLMGVRLLKPAVATGFGKVVDQIERSARRIEKMVEQLLDMTRGRLGEGISIHPKPVNLTRLIESTVQELALAHSRATFNLALPAEIIGLWDPDRLEEVVSNLVGNGVEHGDPERPIDVSLEDLADSVRITVRNWGPLIPAELVPQLFDPFRRGHRQANMKSSGLGLGLYISHEIVKAHGGDIRVTSTEAHGSRFIVELPHARA